MKKFLFAVAFGLLSSVPVAADEPKPAPAPAPAPAPVPATTVIGTTTPSVIYPSDTGTTRRGLFGRLRGRNTTRGPAMTTIPSVPTTGTVISTPSTVITTPGTGGTVVPAPMPPVVTPKPSGTSDTSTTTPALTGNPVIVAGGMMTSPEMMPMSATMSSSSRMSTGRTGLIARLRARR